jgi:hypothetical protein
MALIAVLAALKLNLLQFFFGVSWERALLFHKTFAVVALICAAIHGIPQLAGKQSPEIRSDWQLLSGMLMLLLVATQLLS